MPTAPEQPDRLARLLVIEDDPDQLELMTETLEDSLGEGCVISAVCRKDALGHDFQAFDLILTDYNLPDGTGLEMLADIRATCSTPVIMVTGENAVDIATSAIRNGATDYVVKTPDYIDTVPLVVQKSLAMTQMLRERETVHRQALSQLQSDVQRAEQEAATDPLTGLYNRRNFEKHLNQLFAECQRYPSNLSAVMLDLDHFKSINDTLGHQVGDDMIVLAGKTIAEVLRTMDVASRYGGDEFVLLFPKADAQTTAGIMQRLRNSFWNRSGQALAREVGLTMSIGIADVAGSGVSTPEALIAAADEALYRAKAAGRDCIAGPDFTMPRADAA
ncbi:MAG: diguanylate cyclase [Planctomycetota bacterium]